MDDRESLNETEGKRMKLVLFLLKKKKKNSNKSNP